MTNLEFTIFSEFSTGVVVRVEELDDQDEMYDGEKKDMDFFWKAKIFSY